VELAHERFKQLTGPMELNAHSAKCIVTQHPERLMLCGSIATAKDGTEIPVYRKRRRRYVKTPPQ
jgi:hypothetical protein